MNERRIALCALVAISVAVLPVHGDGWNVPAGANGLGFSLLSSVESESVRTAGARSDYSLGGVVDVGLVVRVLGDDLVDYRTDATQLGAAFAIHPFKQADGAVATFAVESELYYRVSIDPPADGNYAEQRETGSSIAGIVGRDLHIGSVFFLRTAMVTAVDFATTVSILSDAGGETEDVSDQPIIERRSGFFGGARFGLGLRFARGTVVLDADVLYSSDGDTIVRPRVGFTVIDTRRQSRP